MIKHCVYFAFSIAFNEMVSLHSIESKIPDNDCSKALFGVRFSLYKKINLILNDENEKPHRNYSSTISIKYMQGEKHNAFLHVYNRLGFPHIKNRYRRAASSKLIKSLQRNDNDPTARVLADVTRKVGKESHNTCHVVLYYDEDTVSEENIRTFQQELNIPVVLLDVSKLRFRLMTKTRDDELPIISLLKNRTGGKDTCRIIVSWSNVRFQKVLLLLLKVVPSTMLETDHLIFYTNDRSLNNFLPEIRSRVVVRREVSLTSRSSQLQEDPLKFVVEKPCKDCDSRVFSNVGEWKREQGLLWTTTRPNYGLRGSEITVSYTKSLPNVFNKSNSMLDGVEYRMLEYASRVLNFSFSLREPVDGEWGKFINGTWTGKVGDIIRKEADLAIGGIVYQTGRASVVSYSVMFHNELWGIVCPPPTKMPLWPYILFPFRGKTAQSFFAFLVLMHIIGFLVIIFIACLKTVKNDKAKKHPLSKSIQKVFTAAASLYLRLMVCLYFLNLFYCIIEPEYDEPITSSLALLASQKKWGLVKGTTVFPVLSSSLDSSHRSIAKQTHLLSSIAEGFKQLDNDGHCIVGVPKRYAKSRITTHYTTQCSESALQVSAEDLHTVQGGWIMEMNSPIKKMIDPVIRRLQGFGLLEKWTGDLYAELSKRRQERLPCIQQPLGPLSLSDLRLAFYLIVAGCLFAVLIFIIENGVSLLLKAVGYISPIENSRLHLGSKTSGQSFRSTPKTWPAELVNQIASDKDSNRQSMLHKEAVYRYNIMLLLRNEQLELHSTREHNSKPLQTPSEVETISNTVVSHEPSNESRCSSTSNIDNKDSLVDKNSDIDLHLHVNSHTTQAAITEVKPYESQLSRAARILPKADTSSDENSIRYIGRLPQRPDSPPSRLPPMKDPIGWLIRRMSKNIGGVEKKTLQEIENSKPANDSRYDTTKDERH